MSISTAILVFAQPVASDASGKCLSAHTEANHRLFNLLNGRVQRTVAQTGLPILQSTDLITHTGSFGAQLGAAMLAVFDRGYERVLVVGNDCPALSRADLLKATEQLQAGQLVLGPDQRGGVYLLGLSRAQFDMDAFVHLPWQTTQFRQTFCKVYSAWPVILLRPLGDINHQDDIRGCGPEGDPVNYFVLHLLSVLFSDSVSPAQRRIRPLRSPRVYHSGPRRAPPSFFPSTYSL